MFCLLFVYVFNSFCSMSVLDEVNTSIRYNERPPLWRLVLFLPIQFQLLKNRILSEREHAQWEKARCRAFSHWAWATILEDFPIFDTSTATPIPRMIIALIPHSRPLADRNWLDSMGTNFLRFFYFFMEFFPFWNLPIGKDPGKSSCWLGLWPRQSGAFTNR